MGRLLGQLESKNGTYKETKEYLGGTITKYYVKYIPEFGILKHHIKGEAREQYDNSGKTIAFRPRNILERTIK